MGRKRSGGYDEASIEALTTNLIRGCREGQAKADEAIVQRFSDRLLDFAKRQIGQVLQARIDPEDAVQSAFCSFFWRVRDGQFQIDDSSSLWRLLATITLNKIRKAGRKKAERGELPTDAADKQETPEELVALTDEIQELLEGLHPRCGAVLLLALEGYSVLEMADKLDCSRWTVRRALNSIGERAHKRGLDCLKEMEGK